MQHFVLLNVIKSHLLTRLLLFSLVAQKTSVRTVTQTERIHQTLSAQTENSHQKKTRREVGAQTE